MTTLYEHEVLVDSIRSAISDLGMNDEDLDVVLKTLSGVAMDDAKFSERFAYTMKPEAYQTSARKSDMVTVGTMHSEVVPKLEMPVYSFKRESKPVVRVRSKLDTASIAMFNRNYGDELDLIYSQISEHDHATAAMSRKIEYEILLKHAWENYANPLLLPTNYDFSVIDVGGDWGTVLSRKQFGIHVCNPVLDIRDRTRDLRKRMRDTSGFCDTAYVCHETLQSCCKTAPVAISLHSSYDINPKDIVISMIKRGIVLYTGTMFLPEGFDKISKYSDKSYGYNIVIDKPNITLEKLYSHLSGDIIDSRTRGETLVIYSFPNGESREYCHNYENLLKYTQQKTYKLRVDNNANDVIIDYKIVRRVGSLVYFEFRQNFERQPANISFTKTVQKEPFNGYRAKLDASFIRNTAIYGATPVEILIPRGLFDVVASYCLTRVTAEDFTIENVLAYTRSVMSSIQINESTLVLNDGDDSFELMVTCALASYQWAHERYRLMESRVPHRSFIEQYNDTSNSLDSMVNAVINKEKLVAEAKATAIKVGSTVVDTMFLENPALKTRMDKIISLVKAIKSPCLIELIDMEFLIEPIDIIHHELSTSDTSSHESILVSPNCKYVLPTYPDYNQSVLPAIGKSTHRKSRFIEAEQLLNEITEKRFKNITAYSTLQSLDLPVPVDELDVIIDENNAETDINSEELQTLVTAKTNNDHEFHVKAICDFIVLAENGDKEHLDSAKNLIHTIMDGSCIPSTLVAQANLKHEPIILACLDGEVDSIRSLNKIVHKGEPEFTIKLEQYNKMYFCTQLYEGNTGEKTFRRLQLNGLKFDKDKDSVRENFDAIYVSEIQIIIAHMYKSLINRILATKFCQGNNADTILTNGVAGCGKTHIQVHSFKDDTLKGYSPAIFSATKAAAGQALSRLQELNVPSSEDNVCTVDSFLMNRTKWKLYSHIYIDEALQLHCGKLFAILEITNPKVLTGFGDRRQITFTNFTRFSHPTVDTDFLWKSEIKNMLTRRIKNGKRISWLKDDQLYGPEFDTVQKHLNDRISVFASFVGLEKKISVNWLYKTLRLDKNEPLLVLVYRKDVANDLRMKLKVTRTIPDEGSEHRLAIETIGESQGEDVAHSVLLRMSSRQEPLFDKSDQTIVGLTRSFSSWGYITVPSNFPSLLERVITRSDDTLEFKVIQDNE